MFVINKQKHTVRSKVSLWVTNFVSEMKTKSPAVVQRWVDSLPHDKYTDIVIEPHTHDTFDDLDSSEKVEAIEDSIAHDSFILVSSVSEGPTIEIVSDTETSTDALTAIANKCNQPPAAGRFVGHKSFWRRRPSILVAALHQSKSQSTETDDLTASDQSSQPDKPSEPIEIRLNSIELDEPTTSISANADATTTSTSTTNTTSTILAKSKLTELYDKFGISKKRYDYFKARKMEAKRILSNAKSRFLASAAAQDDLSNDHDSSLLGFSDDDDVTRNMCAESMDTNAIGMDTSTDELSHLSHSNELLLVHDDNDIRRPTDDEDDSFNVSMPSVNDGSTSQLSTSRRIPMADIGRSTSDNPRLRNKTYLGDIGRSFSENQDDDTIFIGERNISAPSSSIAIQNNNRPNGALYERRAYSVSPTQRGLKRGTLSREQSLSDSSRHRHHLSKGSSFQSDSSHCSSVESLLDARKPDPEAILRQLGFAPAYQENLLSRIPSR